MAQQQNSGKLPSVLDVLLRKHPKPRLSGYGENALRPTKVDGNTGARRNDNTLTADMVELRPWQDFTLANIKSFFSYGLKMRYREDLQWSPPPPPQKGRDSEEEQGPAPTEFDVDLRDNVMHLVNTCQGMPVDTPFYALVVNKDNGTGTHSAAPGRPARSTRDNADRVWQCTGRTYYTTASVLGISCSSADFGPGIIAQADDSTAAAHWQRLPVINAVVGRLLEANLRYGFIVTDASLVALRISSSGVGSGSGSASGSPASHGHCKLNRAPGPSSQCRGLCHVDSCTLHVFLPKQERVEVVDME